MIPTLRTLTRKSKFGFGYKKDLTMQKLLDLNKKLDLIGAYYKLTSINFTDDILKELGIVDKWVIKKPSSNKEMYYEFLEHINHNYMSGFSRGADKLKKPIKIPSKLKLRSFNQNN